MHDQSTFSQFQRMCVSLCVFVYVCVNEAPELTACMCKVLNCMCTDEIISAQTVYLNTGRSCSQPNRVRKLIMPDGMSKCAIYNVSMTLELYQL